jgi:hypothetical protein
METVTLSTNLVNAVLNYLASKPYAEVAPIIAAFQKELPAPTTSEGE